MTVRSLDELYPTAAWDLPVSLALPTPRRAVLLADVSNFSRYREYYGENILTQRPIPNAVERLVFIDKAFAHALCDVMVLIGRDDRIHTNVGDTPPPVTKALLRAASAFVRFLSEPDTVHRYGLDEGHAVIGWNYDPTVDRENGQFYDKRMHWHLNCFLPGAWNSAVPIPLREIADPGLRRTIVDPAGYLAQRVMADALRLIRLPADCEVIPIDPRWDAAKCVPIGLKIRIPGWDFVESDTCGTLLSTLHRVAAEAYGTVYDAFTGEPVGLPLVWQRPALLPKREVVARLDKVDWLNDATKNSLTELRGLLRDVTEREMKILRSRMDAAIRCLTLGGLSYNLAFYTPQPVHADVPMFATDELYIVMQFKLFSPMGQAPAMSRTVASRLNRAAGAPMTDEESYLRAAFQRQYLDLIE